MVERIGKKVGTGPNLQLRIPDARKEELEILAVRHRMKLKPMVVEALRLLEAKWAADDGLPSPFTPLGENGTYYFAESGVQFEADRLLHIKLAEAIRIWGEDARLAVEACLVGLSAPVHRRQKGRDAEAPVVGQLEPEPTIAAAARDAGADTESAEEALRRARELKGSPANAKRGRGGVGDSRGKRKPPPAA